MKIIIHGALGRMGQALFTLAESKGITVASQVDRGASSADAILSDITEFQGEADVVIDFSHHSAVIPLLDYCVAHKLPVVIATTGHSTDEHAAIDTAAEAIPIFRSANMSVGIALLRRMVKQAAATLAESDVELIDIHHNRKLDAPSGTALMLTDAVQEARPDSKVVMGRSGMEKRGKDEITIHSLRMGNVVGDHEVIFATDNETITLKHEAHDRSLFADGALCAALFIADQLPGLYDMDDLLEHVAE